MHGRLPSFRRMTIYCRRIDIAETATLMQAAAFTLSPCRAGAMRRFASAIRHAAAFDAISLAGHEREQYVATQAFQCRTTRQACALCRERLT